MRAKFEKFGILLLTLFSVLMGLLLVADDQYWRKLAYGHSRSYKEPTIPLINLLGHAHVLVLLAAGLSIVASLLLWGRYELLGLATFWLAFGLCLKSNLANELGHWFWLPVVISSFAVIGPDLGFGHRGARQPKTLLTLEEARR